MTHSFALLVIALEMADMKTPTWRATSTLTMDELDAGDRNIVPRLQVRLLSHEKRKLQYIQYP